MPREERAAGVASGHRVPDGPEQRLQRLRGCEQAGGSAAQATRRNLPMIYAPVPHIQPQRLRESKRGGSAARAHRADLHTIHD
jgi:hypothetical protein